MKFLRHIVSRVQDCLLQARPSRSLADGRQQGSRRRNKLRPNLEPLQLRTLPSTFVDLGPVFSVTGVNSSADAVGTVPPSTNAANTYEAFYASGSNLQEVAPPAGYTTSYGDAINDSGQVAGNFGKASGTNSGEGFLYNVNTGSLTNLPSLDGSNVIPTSINDAGQAVGYSASGHPFLWSSLSGIEDLSTLGLSTDLVPSGINSQGQIVSHGEGSNFGPLMQSFLWNRPGDVVTIPTLGGAATEATAINDSGQVVGSSTTTNNENPVHAFLWTQGTTPLDLGTIEGFSSSYASAINDEGVVVGTLGGNGGTTKAFIYENSTMLDLNSLPGIPSGWTLETATAINDDGVVAGIGFDPAGQQRGYLFNTSPTPPPPPPPPLPPASTPNIGLSSSLNPATFGHQVTFTVIVSAASSGLPMPTGTVTFEDGSASIGSGALNASGIATFTTSTLVVGTHSISAVYGGDSNFNGNTSMTVKQVVNPPIIVDPPPPPLPPPREPSTITITASPRATTFGRRVALTATVRSLIHGRGTPTGEISFIDGTTILDTATLEKGRVRFSTSSLPIGRDPIQVQYSGNAGFTPSRSAVVIVNVRAHRSKAKAGASPATIKDGSLIIPPHHANGYSVSSVDGQQADSTPPVLEIQPLDQELTADRGVIDKRKRRQDAS